MFVLRRTVAVSFHYTNDDKHCVYLRIAFGRTRSASNFRADDVLCRVL